LRRINSQPKK